MRKRLVRFKQWLSVCGLLLVLALFLAPVSHAQMALEGLESFLQNQYGMSIADLQIPDLNITYGNNLSMTCPVEFDLLAKAQPDECYNGPCESNNKVNQAYVWGMTIDGDGKIWFGTAPNTHCLVLSGYLGLSGGLETDSYVCEGGLSDWRAPEIYSYDPKTETLTKHPTPEEIFIKPILATIFDTTLGIRSAGSLGDIIFLAGPSKPSIGTGVNIFAFDTNGNYLGSTDLNNLGIITNETLNATNIRKWLVAGGNLYTAIGTTTGGRVLKWTGDTDDPFQFEVVGVLDSGEGAELALHDGRIFVSTWPAPGGPDVAGLFMSPLLSDNGNDYLEDIDADDWIKVWEVTDYEPDMITAGTYGGGALASFDGHLYWGTMHVPFLSFVAYASIDGFSSPEEAIEAFLGSYRAISIFRGDGFGTTEEQIDLVYGMPVLPVATPTPDSPPGTYDWNLTDNNMDGAFPMYGPSGFGNMFNNYTWSMQVFDNKLWIGTMDWSYLLGDLASGPLTDLIENQYNITIPELPETFTNLPKYFYGADLFCIAGSNVPALPLCLSGLGNYTNYGIRNMVADETDLDNPENNRIYFGMANPMNLLPEGGWELRSRGNLEVDGDLVSADIEDMAPNGGDGNYDNTPDSQQPNVASIRPNNSSNVITVELFPADPEDQDVPNPCNQIRGIMPIPNDFLPPDEEFNHPYGNMYIMLQCPPQTEETKIRIYYHGINSYSGLIYRKFGQTDESPLPSWYTLDDIPTMGGEPRVDFGRTDNGVVYVDLILTNNGPGDFIRTGTGGPGGLFIIDPGGPARAQSMAIPTLSEWGMIFTMILLGFTGIVYMRKRRITEYK